MRLGRLIEKLEAMPPEATVWFKPVGDDVEGLGDHPGTFCSYRGYYERLALEPDAPPCTVAELLTRARACVGATFTGWKGGEFTMRSNTMVHLARAGETSDNRIVGVEHGDSGGANLLVSHVEDW